ncbi:DUF5336 domain-containing protein [Streptomyces sp. NPDC048448]|uniref:DUF5336 domain-containing protein n=1 Tax=Streptomyces kaempferi TaxID=333725 RepID=A0ABW3XM91_9ACTN|nr:MULTISPECIES: DUF5336 domain-containing protein [unclassified Streptomyces]QIY62407.1 hypothetical protein HEP85_12860 [Streptomyces sp. RPA4-2]
MNIRSLTRGDGVVIGAAVLLFIASFLAIFSIDDVTIGGQTISTESPSTWASGSFVLSVVLAGIIGAGLVVASRALPQVPKVAGLDLGPFGVALTVFAAWSALGNVFDPTGGVNNVKNAGSGVGPGIGLILALIATLVMAAAAIATPLVPALQVALVPAPKPATPQPYGGQPQGGYGYPGAPQPGQPYGGQPQQGQSFGAQPSQPQQAPAPQAQQPAGDFSPFWFAVPVPRPLFSEDGSPAPIAELAPGTWYLAVEQRGQHLVAQTQDGRRGVLQDMSGIQRG